MEHAVMNGTKLLFEESFSLSGVTEYGFRWQDLVAGRVPVPPEGARFDVAFEGTFRGPRLSGVLRGVDFLEVRADGRFNLRIFATLTADTGEHIALEEQGLLTPSPSGGPASLRLVMSFRTAHPAYAWLNEVQAWAAGQVDMQTGMGTVQAYL
jgi:hypothetical protein